MGNKEIFCEELAPAFIDSGMKVVQIIRDPRDVISSLHFRKRDNQTGDPRPLLFNLRIWRKSAAFALALADHPSFRMIRFEDLLDDSSGQLTMLTEWLGVDDYAPDAFAEGIRDHDGSLWRGNSSFGDKAGISKAASGSYKELVPLESVRYIETLCGPEMSALGYDLTTRDRLDRAGLEGFREPSDRVHPLFDPDYSTDAERLGAETARLEHLSPSSAPLDETDARTWFIHVGAYAALRASAERPDEEA